MLDMGYQPTSNLPSVKEAWRWVRKVVDEFGQLAQSETSLQDFISTIKKQLEFVEIPASIQKEAFENAKDQNFNSGD